MAVSDTHDATMYVQLEPEFWTFRGETKVRDIRAVRMTQKRPVHQRGGTVLVKLTIRVPDNAFLPLRPEAIVVVPESMTSAEPVTVEAVEL